MKQIKPKAVIIFFFFLLIFIGLTGCGANQNGDENTEPNAETEFAEDYLRGVYIEITSVNDYLPPVMDFDNENAQYVMIWEKIIDPGFKLYDTAKKGKGFEVTNLHVFSGKIMLHRVELEIEILMSDAEDSIVNVYPILQKESRELYLGGRIWTNGTGPAQKVIQPANSTSYFVQHLTRNKIRYGELTEETYDYNLSIRYM